MIEAAGFGDVAIEGPFDPFAGAGGEGNARTFETMGWTFRAVKTGEAGPLTTPTACDI